MRIKSGRTGIWSYGVCAPWPLFISVQSANVIEEESSLWPRFYYVNERVNERVHLHKVVNKVPTFVTFIVSLKKAAQQNSSQCRCCPSMPAARVFSWSSGSFQSSSMGTRGQQLFSLRSEH